MATVTFNGQEYTFPDEATDQQIADALQQYVVKAPAGDYTLENKMPVQQTGEEELPGFAGAGQRVTGPTPGESLTTPDTASKGYEFSRAIFDEVGTMLGIPAGTLAEFGKYLQGRTDSIDPARGIGEFKQFLQSQGIPQGQVDTVASKFGSDLTWNLVLTGMGVGAGRSMTAPFMQGGKIITKEEALAGKTGLDKYLTGNRYSIGRALSESPTQQIGSAVGGSATQALGEEWTGEDPAGSFISYVPGMVMGGYASRRLKGIFERAVRPRATTPIVNDQADRMSVAIPAEDRVSRDIENLDRLTQDATEGTKGQPWSGVRPWVYRNGKPVRRMTDAEAQTAFEKSRDYAESSFRQIESAYWKKATEGQPVEALPIQTKVAAWAEDQFQNGTQGTTPQRFVDEIAQWPPAVSIDKIEKTISDMYAERRRIYARNSDFASDKGAYARNLGQLEDILREGQAANAPNPQALADARAFTRARKARFVDGPMGEARYMEGQGSSVSTDPTTGKVETLDFRREAQAPHIARTMGGPAQVKMVQNVFDKLGIQSSIADDFENAVRSDYLQTTIDPQTQMPNPAKAQRWLDQHKGTLGLYKSLLRDIENHVALIRANMDEQKAIAKSVYAQVANATENTMASKVFNAFNHPDSVNRVKDLTTTFSIYQGKKLPPDHEFIQAWEKLAVEALLKKGQTAKGVQQLMQDPTWSKNLKQAFANNPDTLERLRKAVDLGVNLETEGVKGDLTGALRNQTVFWSGIFGAGVGRSLNSGTVQVPGYFAKSARNWVSSAFAKIMPAPPGEKLYWAIHTPEGFNWLTRNSWEGTPGLRKAVKSGRRMMAVINTQTHEKMRRWMDENGLRPRDDAGYLE